MPLTRIATAAVALPLFVLLIWLVPAPIFSALAALATMWGVHEVLAMGVRPAVSVRISVAITTLVAMAALLIGGGTLCWPLAWLAAVAGGVMVAMVEWGGRRPQKLVVVLGSLYVAIALPYLALVRNRPQGWRWLLLMVAIVVATDSAAYAAGSRWGRRKLLARVSPGKTLEGALGGLTGGLLAGLVLSQVFGVGWEPWWRTAGLALAISAVSQAGDLAESALKRLRGAKDSGRLFPGHGGLLDRADSLMLAALFTYYTVR
ncbi:MAG TPA: phosphatidate cytidylyltransferase [Candidatus Binataceae bacterium]|nr:phosphatidate cytidylyltransferase [Candidatus Binataceae bacterium]